jgi:hypothetical protein
MPRLPGRREGSSMCTVCKHPERGRIDFLRATGGSPKALAAKFGLKATAVYNHCKKHISSEYIAAVRIGPFQSEEHLRKLCAEAGGSVVENLMAIYGGLASRWLSAFEAGDDGTLSLLTQRLHKNLELRARLTHELLPPGPTSVTNNILLNDPGYLAAIGQIAVSLAPFPEARVAVAKALRSFDHSGPLMIEGAATAGAND